MSGKTKCGMSKKMEYFSATLTSEGLKLIPIVWQNQSLIHVTAWTNLKEVILSEKSQSPKDMCWMTSLM